MKIRHVLFLTFLVLLIFVTTLFVISKYVPIFLPSVTSDIYLLGVVIISVATFLAAIKDISELIDRLFLQKRKTRIVKFPFNVIPPNSDVLKMIFGGSDKDPLADRNIPYYDRVPTQKVRRDLENILYDHRWVLILGRTGLGKTREAAHVAQTLNREGWFVLNLTRSEWLDAPTIFPKEIPTDRKILFFIDDLNRKIYGSHIEQPPDQDSHPIAPFQIRLLRTLETFETLCGKQEILVIANARNEKSRIFLEEPSEWEKLEFDEYRKLWDRFVIYDLPEPEDETLVNLLKDIVPKARIHADPKDFPLLAQRNDRTFANIIENLRTTRINRDKLTPENFRETLNGTWESRYNDAIRKYPGAKYVYDAVELLQLVKIELLLSTVKATANLIADGNIWKQIQCQVQIRLALSYLINSERILKPRDGQIEAKGERVDSEIYFSRLAELFPKLARRKPSELLNSLLRFGDVLRDAKEYEHAIKMFNKYITFAPLEASPYHRLGHLYGDYLDQSENAISSFLQAIELEPGDAAHYGCLAGQYRVIGQYKNAITFYKSAIDLDPLYSGYYVGIGIAYLKINDNYKAKTYLNKAIELESNYSLPYYILGQIAVEEGNIDEADKAFIKAIDTDNTDSDLRISVNLIKHGRYELSSSAAAHLELARVHKGDELADVHKKFDHLDKAISEYEALIEISPENDTFLHIIGHLYKEAGKKDEAIKNLSRAHDLDPKNLDHLKCLGEMYLDFGNTQGALDVFQKMVVLYPKEATPFHKLGHLYGDHLDQSENAIASFLHAIELEPDNAAHYECLGNYYRNSNQNLEAVEAYKLALNIKPDDSSLSFILGQVLHELKRFEEEILEYKKALEIDPNNPSIHLFLGFAYNELNQKKNAVNSFIRALEIDPTRENYPLLCVISSLCADIGLNNEAEIYWQRAFNLEPGNPYSYHLHGHVYAKAGNLNESISSFENAIKLNPEDAVNYKCLGVVLSENNRIVDAIAAFQKAIELESNDIDAHTRLGDLFMAGKRFDEALVSFTHAIKLAPENARGYRNRADLLITLERYDEAEKDCKMSLDLAPNHPYTHARFGQLSYAKQAFDEAIAHFNNAIKLADDETEFNFDIALPLLCLGRTEEALDLIQQRLVYFEHQPDIIDIIAKYKDLYSRNPSIPGLDQAISMMES